MTEPKRLFLIDGHALAYRSYFAFIRNPLINSKGENTGAVFGFTSALLKIIREHKPSHLAVVFDTAAPTFRHKMYPAYKSTRVKMPDEMRDQMPRIRQVVEAMNIVTLEQEGFEADDLMGTLARCAERQSLEVVLVSGDKDFLQLVSERVKVLNPRRRGEDPVLFDEAKVEEKFGVPPNRVVEVLGLMGDSSDNVSGVPGIGPKTAIDLIQRFGDIETAIARADEISSRRVQQNLLQNADLARLSRELVTIKVHMEVAAEIEDLRLREFNGRRLLELFRELEFTSLMRDISVEDDGEEVIYSLVSTRKELSRLLDSLRKAGSFVLDLETTSADPMRAELVGLSFCAAPRQAYYIPVGHREGPNLDLKLVLDELRPLLGDGEIKKCGQNIKYDFTVLARYDCPLCGIEFDTMVASYLLNPSARRHNLDLLSLEHLGHKKIPLQQLIGKGKAQKSFALVPVNLACRYACEDADFTWRLWNILQEKLEEQGVLDLFSRVEMPLVEVLARMEMNGVCLDVDFLREMSQELEEELNGLIEQIYDLAGEQFNINSPKQLGVILFQKLNLPIIQRTKTGYSTKEEVLEELVREHALPRKLLDYRQLMKLKSTYVDALPRMVNPRTGRIHTSFNQTVTATGRLSSSGPNLQNIPVRTEFSKKIRQAFIAPDENHHILSADYSQIELRIMAHLSQDPTLLKSFRRDEDVHTRTAALVFGVCEQDVTPELRRQAKVVNFGIMYGMSPYGLARQLEITAQEAGRFIEDYFKLYPGVKEYVEGTIQQAQKKGYVTTLLNRRRYLPELNSDRSSMVAFAKRTAVNTPIQGTAADLIKVAMIEIDRELRGRGWQAKMIIQIHDELVFEIPKEELNQVSEMIRSKMENALSLKVPIKVDIGVGKNWYEAH
ncbi:DNA polymerase I [bacterium]|nr:DNA polymerase I [bacterium]